MTDLDDALTSWLPRQRWCSDKGRPDVRVAVESDVELARADDADGPTALHLVVAGLTSSDGRPSTRYWVPLGRRDHLPARLQHAVVDGAAGTYDALADTTLTGLLTRELARGGDLGPVRARRETSADDADDSHGNDPLDGEDDLTTRPLGAEQSNSSVVLGERLVLKVFRRAQPGENPDLELTRALTRQASPHVAPVRGWLETDLDSEPTTVGLLQDFLATGSDGWAAATASARDLFVEGDLHADEVGGDFAAESERLGAAVARVHADLRDGLGVAEAGADGVRALVERARGRLDEAASLSDDVDAVRSGAHELLDRVEAGASSLQVQRVHGDLHLGQTLRNEHGWFLLDFEGEPADPVARRREPDSLLRDVAGLLRSYDYCARHLAAQMGGSPEEDDQRRYRALEWTRRNVAALLDGYAAEAGTDPRADDLLLRTYQLDKAAYEVVYEARNRPTWLRVPVDAVVRLVQEG